MIRAESRVVRVDVIVTDKKGNYVHDLTPKDFRVYDNDKEQQIVNFSFGSSESAQQTPERHYMVLFFDDSTMDFANQAQARQAALKFIDADAGPDRVMAVVDFTGALRIIQNFTGDPAQLKRATEYAKSSAGLANDSDSPGAAAQAGAPDAQPLQHWKRFRRLHVAARDPHAGSVRHTPAHILVRVAGEVF